jgi:hypothetical protein
VSLTAIVKPSSATAARRAQPWPRRPWRAPPNAPFVGCPDHRRWHGGVDQSTQERRTLAGSIVWPAFHAPILLACPRERLRLTCGPEGSLYAALSPGLGADRDAARPGERLRERDGDTARRRRRSPVPPARGGDDRAARRRASAPRPGCRRRHAWKRDPCGFVSARYHPPASRNVLWPRAGDARAPRPWRSTGCKGQQRGDCIARGGGEDISGPACGNPPKGGCGRGGR